MERFFVTLPKGRSWEAVDFTLSSNREHGQMVIKTVVFNSGHQIWKLRHTIQYSPLQREKGALEILSGHFLRQNRGAAARQVGWRSAQVSKYHRKRMGKVKMLLGSRGFKVVVP